MAEKKNKTLKKARVEMNYLTGDEAVRRAAELREKWDIEWEVSIRNARKAGTEAGRKLREKERKKVRTRRTEEN